MNNMYDILDKFNSVAGKQTLTENVDPVAFAALAPPKDKITFADKIAGAKKEVDEMLGDVAAEAMKKAVVGLKNERGPEEIEEISMDQIGRGIGKAIGVPARIAGAVAGIPQGMKQAYQTSKQGAVKAISGQDVDCYPKTSKMAEDDMEEGNDFTGARLAAIKAGKPTFSVGGKTFKVTGDTSDEKMMEKKEKTLWPGTPEYEKKFPKDMRAGEKKRSSTGGTIEKTDTGIKHTAKAHDDEEADADAKDDGAPKKKGRPKGSKRALGAKVKGTSKLHRKPSIKEMDMEEDHEISLLDKGEYDQEGDMARQQMHTAVDAAKELHSILDADENLPEWVQQKIAKAVDMLDTVRDYMKSSKAEQGVEERKLTKPEMSKREKYVKSMKKSKGDFEKRYGERGEEVMYATATKMAKKKAEESKDKEEVEETTVAGSVATAPAEAPKAKGKKGAIQFGKGIYEAKLEEGFKSRLEQMLTEGMSINASQSEDGTKSLSVNATDEDAVKLAQILQLAGMPQGHDYHDVCPACGKAPCGCEEVEESLANAPDPVYANTEMINTQGEDLHKPKSTGQTTVPILNKDAARQGVSHEMAKIKEETEGRLWKLYQKYEAQ